MEILVQGHVGLNRAVDGDVVALELLPENEWSVPSDLVLQDEGDEDPGDVLDEENELIVKKSTNQVEGTPTGKIVGIIRRKWRQYCGILQPSPIKGVISQFNCEAVQLNGVYYRSAVLEKNRNFSSSECEASLRAGRAKDTQGPN